VTPYPQRALSVDDQETTAALVEKHKLTFPVGYGADARAVAGLTGAFVNHSRFPAGYEEGHTPGLRLLRVAARVRAEHGPAGATLALRATDQDLTENTGTVLGRPGGVHWHGRPASGDLTLSGPVTGLLLALLRRKPAKDTGISMQGDTALWRSWLALTPLWPPGLLTA